MACDLMDGRDAFLTLAREKHLEFSSLRRTKYSSMVLLYELHTQGQVKSQLFMISTWIIQMIFLSSRTNLCTHVTLVQRVSRRDTIALCATTSISVYHATPKRSILIGWRNLALTWTVS